MKNEKAAPATRAERPFGRVVGGVRTTAREIHTH